MYTKSEHRNLILYFVLTYLLFWILIGVTGLMISLDVPELTQTIMKNVSAWSPTFVILLMFKRLYPNIRLRDFVRNNLLSKTKPRYFVIVFLLQSAIFVGAVTAYLVLNNLKLESLSFLSITSLIPTILLIATSGATGEELGWRAYALNLYQKKYSPLKSAIFVGLVWGFWHLPLMIFSGYSGLELVYYCFFFLLAFLSLSIVITFFYNKGRSILIAMWIHFLFNFFIQLVKVDLLQLLIYLSAGYLLLAFLLFVSHKNELLNTSSEN